MQSSITNHSSLCSPYLGRKGTFIPLKVSSSWLQAIILILHASSSNNILKLKKKHINKYRKAPNSQAAPLHSIPSQEQSRQWSGEEKGKVNQVSCFLDLLIHFSFFFATICCLLICSVQLDPSSCIYGGSI